MRAHVATDQQRDFGQYLREQREQKQVDLTAIAAETRIPMRSLRHLEQGAFDKLPADIFIRGFLRSYADCVGLDQKEILERYIDLGIKPPSFSGDIVAAVRQSRARRSDATPLPEPSLDAVAPEVPDDEPDDAPKRKRPRTLLPRLAKGEEPGRRAPMTLAVIILLIVATLTMSYLLRKPSSDSDGYTAADHPADIAV